jgi:hypothetical protein
LCHTSKTIKPYVEPHYHDFNQLSMNLFDHKMKKMRHIGDTSKGDF